MLNEYYDRLINKDTDALVKRVYVYCSIVPCFS